MTDPDKTSKPEPRSRRDVVDKLVFAALREQIRARRWRVFFMLFFIVYLAFVTIVLLSDTGDAYGVGGKADGKKHTAVVKLAGVIADGEPGGSDTLIEGLKKAFEHEDTAGIVIEINSPGGSPVQAAYIFDEIMRLREKHGSVPVYAVVTDIAASGGYYVAAAANRIYVNRSSLVGSIGVRLDSFGFVGLMEKIGVERRLLTAGQYKGLYDPFLPERAEEKTHLQTTLGQVHEHFIDAVKRGRGERLQAHPDIFSGLVWSGEESIELGLADAYGSTRSVARELDAENIIDFTPKRDVLQRIADRIGSSFGRSISESLLRGPALY